MYFWRDVSTDETSTLNSTKSRSKVLLLKSKSLWFFFWKDFTKVLNYAMMGWMFSRLCFSRVLNCLIVEKSSFSLVMRRQNKSNLPKI